MNLVDLIHHRLVLVAPMPLNFDHADRRDRFQVSVLQTPVDRLFYCLEHAVPAHTKRFRNLLPGHPSRPFGQVPRVFGCHRALPLGPGNSFHLPSTLRAVDPSHGVNEHNRNSPQWNEAKTPRHRHRVITGDPLSAAGTDWLPVGRRFNLYVQRRSQGIVLPSDLPKHKRLIIRDAIEGSFQVYPAPLELDSCATQSITEGRAGYTIKSNTPRALSQVCQASSSFHLSGLTLERSAWPRRMKGRKTLSKRKTTLPPSTSKPGFVVQISEGPHVSITTCLTPLFTHRTFFSSDHEVTQHQYQQVMGNNLSVSKGANKPVESVTWTDAVEFFCKLSEQEEVNTAYQPK